MIKMRLAFRLLIASSVQSNKIPLSLLRWFFTYKYLFLFKKIAKLLLTMVPLRALFLGLMVIYSEKGLLTYGSEDNALVPATATPRTYSSSDNNTLRSKLQLPCYILNQTSLKFLPNVPNNTYLTMVQMIARCQSSVKCH